MTQDNGKIPVGYALPQPMDWEQLKPRVNYPTRADHLRFVMKLVADVPGHVCEFGVAHGGSTRVIQSEIRKQSKLPFGGRKLYAFDSFEGLREKFENAEVGAFACEVPKIRDVNFVKGYFEDTCTDELRRKIGKVAFAHLDADLYSSTIFVLNWLTPMLSTGSLLLFDEFVGGEQAEARAFYDWLEQSKVTLVRIAEFDRNPSGWGEKLDRRLLYQVVGEEPHPANGQVKKTVRRVGNKLQRMLSR
jgi:hypothetical protein